MEGDILGKIRVNGRRTAREGKKRNHRGRA